MLVGGANISREAERDLLRRWQERGDQRARDALVRAHWPIFRRVAYRCRQPGVTVEDLVQTAAIAFARSLDAVDPWGHDVRLSTYAARPMMRATHKFAIESRTAITTPYHAYANCVIAARARHALAVEGVAAPSDEQVAERVGRIRGVAVSPATLATQMRVAMASMAFLSDPVGEADGGDCLGDLVADSAPGPDVVVADQIDGERWRELLTAAMEKLSPREREAVRARFWGDDGEGEVLADVGGEMGISRAGASFVVNGALTKLRRYLERRAPWLATTPLGRRWPSVS